MFSKTPTNRPQARTEPGQRSRDGLARPAPSIIGSDMRIAGDVKTDGDVQIEGVIDGDIQSASVTVGRSAEINGEIVADEIRVLGRVNGRIRGRDVTLLESAQVNGDVLHDTLEIARGATIEGMVKPHGREERAAKVNLVVAEAEPAPVPAILHQS